ncbi:hypothetical protein EWM64_g6953 [Hericium alpestre]|uniref:Phosphatase n=1 Tax=Hericium alpestre TaxID=135208 RepID=A0A4Y9ZR43_9AGAM|nr:hypothetical protein EWM64_g6953 [Hericium alpestre]
MPTITLNFDAILFDMDGTLIDSTAGVVGAWELFSKQYPWIDVHDILSSPEPGLGDLHVRDTSLRDRALASVGIDLPEVSVYAEDVEKGKPQPDPYLLGAKRCGVKPENCLVVEDAPAGVRSGNAAGCKTLALLTSHSREAVEAAQPDYIINNLADVSMKLTDSGVSVTITTV